MSFTNIVQWLMVILINAKNVQKMMQQPTGIKILKRFGPMTEIGQKYLKGRKRLKKFLPHGEKPTLIVLKHITQLPEQLEKGYLYVVPAFDAENKNHLLITKIMKSLWKLFGFVNRATNNGIKN